MKKVIKQFVRLKKFYIVLILFFFFIFLLSRGNVPPKQSLAYGATFSKKQALDLGLPWKKVFTTSISELKIKKMRLSAYWDEIEPRKGFYDWEDLDWQVDEAQKNNLQIILAVGGRLPRWPECHLPNWAGKLSKQEREKKLLKYIQKTINRYKNYSSIKYWQVENEPFLSNFGECPKLNPSFLDKEISLVKSLDTRPVIITDSGELSLWVPAAKRADVFGTTMYRNTYSERLHSYVHYPIAPGFFRFKKNIAGLFAHPNKWMVIELQAEPWAPIPFQFISEKERSRTMDLEKFKETINFSSKTGFQEFYLWGLEWWYWEKEMQGNPAIWDEAKKLFSNR